MKKRNHLQHLYRVFYDVMIALLSGIVLHGLKLLAPLVLIWISILLDSEKAQNKPYYQMEVIVQSFNVIDTG